MPTAQVASTTTSRPGTVATVVAWCCQVGVALILAQTLYFKFTFAPETRVIFADLGGRPAATAVGVTELLCVLLLVVPRTAIFGALLSLGVIGGAIATHVFVVGIEIVDPATGKGDGGLLFGLALAVALMAGAVVVLRRDALREMVRTFVRR